MTSPNLADANSTTAKINLWLNGGLELLWLLMVLMVPLVFLGRDFATSEAVISYVEVPKIALLRTLTALMGILWLIKWGINGTLPFSSGYTSQLSTIRPSAWLPRVTGWLRESPGNWIILAVVFFLATTVLSTLLSGSIRTSVWGEIPGQDGYSAYTVLSYLLAFGVIATNLKNRPQLWRLLGTVAVMGVLVASYGILQHYGIDFFDLTEETGGGTRRITAFMGNTIFAAAVLSMTIPITLVLAVVSLRETVGFGVPGPLRANIKSFLEDLGMMVLWSLLFGIQLLGITFTLSRGSWLGTVAALGIFIGGTLLFLGWRTSWRASLVGLLSLAFILSFLQSLGSVSILGQGTWFGPIIGIFAIGGMTLVMASWRYFGRAGLAVGIVIVLVALVSLGPSWLGGGGSSVSTGTEQPLSVGDSTADDISERFSSIQSNVLGGFIGGRGTHWRVSWELIKDRPWFEFGSLSVPWLRPLVGYGPDLFRYTYLLRSPVEGIDLLPLEPDHAHNYFIHQTVEQGLLGLLSALGIFAAAFIASIYQLFKRKSVYSHVHKLVLIGLVATIGGRFLEMMVGVARVSDLMVLWILLAALAALPVVMSHIKQEDSPPTPDLEPPVVSRRNRRQSARFNQLAAYDWRKFLRFAIVVWLLGGISVLTWVKGVNYVRAAVAESEGIKHVSQGNLQESLASFDRAIKLAPDVPTYHNNRAQLFLAYQLNENLPPERGCSTQETLPYRVCLAAQNFQSNLEGVSSAPFYYRARMALANSAFNLKLGEEAVNFYAQGSALVPSSWRIKNELAESYIVADRPEEALPVLQGSLAITQDTDLSVAAFYLQGIAYKKLEMPEEAADSYQSALEIESDSASALSAFQDLAQIHSGLGQSVRASIALVLPNMEPRDRTALIRSAGLLQEKDPQVSFEKAHQALAEVYKDSNIKQLADALARLGQEYLKLGDLTLSTLLLEGSAEAYLIVDPNNQKAETIFLRLAVEHGFIGDAEKASQFFLRGLDVVGESKPLPPRPQFGYYATVKRLFELGVEHRDLGELQLAAAFLNLSIDLDTPRDTTRRAYEVLADVYSSLGKSEKAASAFLTLVEFQLEAGDIESARASLEESLRLTSNTIYPEDDPSFLLNAVFGLAKAYRGLGEFTQLALFLDRIVVTVETQQFPTLSAPVFLRLALNYRLLGDEEKSLKFLERGITESGNPRNAAGLVFDLGLDQRDQGDLEESVRFLNFSLELDNSSNAAEITRKVAAEVYFRLAVNYQLGGQFEKSSQRLQSGIDVMQGDQRVAAEILFDLGVGQVEGGSSRVAVALLNRSIELDPSSELAQRAYPALIEAYKGAGQLDGMANILQKTGRPEEALQVLREVMPTLRLEVTAARFFIQGRAYQDLGMLAESAGAFEKGLIGESATESGLYALGALVAIYADLDRPVSSANARVLIQMDPLDRSGLITSAGLLLSNDARTSGERAYQTLVELHKQDNPQTLPNILLHLGEAYGELGETTISTYLLERSAETFLKVDQFHNRAIFIFFLLAVDFRLVDDEERSLLFLERGLRLVGQPAGDPRPVADILFDLERDFRDQGDLKESVIFGAHQALAEAYNSLDLPRRAAHSFLLVGEFQWGKAASEAAKAALERSLELMDNGSTAQRAHEILAELYQSQGNDSLSEKHRELAELGP